MTQTALQTPAQTVRLCLDLKTQRVLYFTADPAYAAPDNAQAYTAEAVLPAGMTLANCWQYRFVTGTLQLSTIANRQPKAGGSLADGNRVALRKALRTKLLALWALLPPWQPASSERATQFAQIEAAYSDRIAAMSAAQTQGLALEIEALVI